MKCGECLKLTTKPCVCLYALMHCFNSSDPVAVNATLMFDFNKDNENLWSRRSQDVPLPPCSSSSTPLVSQCTVCLDRIVHAVCRNLTDGVNVMMEAGGHHVKISKSECPEPPHDDGPQWQLPVAIILILILIIIIIIIIIIRCFFKNKKSCNTPEELRGMEI